MIDPQVRARLFDASTAFDNPVVRYFAITLAILLALAPALIWALGKSKPNSKLQKDLWDRYFSWLIFIPMMLGPVLLGAAWVIIGVGVLGLACYSEFARATGMFRHRLISALVVLGILFITFSVFDHWYGLFAALVPLTLGVMAAASLLADEPKGYIQRLALGIMAFLLFGVCLGHLGFIANDFAYRPLLIWLVCCVQLNDIFAYICGKSFGRRKLAPHTSPNKTLGGALGALILTTITAAILGHLIFNGDPRNDRINVPLHLVALGIIMSVGGQCGDLMLSSIKRDLGIKDWANTFPGHGGLLDRFNSLLFAAPAAFHYIGYLNGLGLDQPRRIFL
jgi:phosphatidate cytidylyltransferase